MMKSLLTLLAFSATLGSGQVWQAGVNIAGFDFGCDTNGDCSPSSADPPLASLGGADGIGQMNHFRSLGLNCFRLPVSWQYLVNNNLGGALDPTNSGRYDQLVQGCLATGAHCIIDIHNYARWYNDIVDQSGGTVTGVHLNSLWQQLAAKYANNVNVVFGIMNEPHDLDINQWAVTVQGVITTIRNQIGNQNQMILVPGTDYTSASTFVSTGSWGALLPLHNPDGSTTNLIFDIHQYLDNAGGTTSTCVTNGINGGLQQLATTLRQAGRQAFLTETGGGSTASCYTDVCAELSWMYSGNGDVYLGWVGWAAGSFAPFPSYAISLTPTFVNGGWQDAGLLTSCILGVFIGTNELHPPPFVSQAQALLSPVMG